VKPEIANDVCKLVNQICGSDLGIYRLGVVKEATKSRGWQIR
jgi:hypothetical protein